MSILVLGGTGFIGRRIIQKLVARGEEIVVMDIAPRPASFDEFGNQVRVVRGDVSRFEDVMEATLAAKPSRVLTLAFLMGSDFPPHTAFRVNIQGVENCFEAARLADVPRVVFTSSLAVNGEQNMFGDHHVNETDGRYGTYQYAMHKIVNEFQAKDYRDKYGMEITALRPANVAGHDKVIGSVDHVQVITAAAREESITFPYRDMMRCVIHVDDVAETFAQVLLKDKPDFDTYNTGGTTYSLGELAELAKEFLPDADIRFTNETGGAANCTNYLIDNSRLLGEFTELNFPPYRQRALEIINDARREIGLPEVTDPKA